VLERLFVWVTALNRPRCPQSPSKMPCVRQAVVLRDPTASNGSLVGSSDERGEARTSHVRRPRAVVRLVYLASSCTTGFMHRAGFPGRLLSSHFVPNYTRGGTHCDGGSKRKRLHLDRDCSSTVSLCFENARAEHDRFACGSHLGIEPYSLARSTTHATPNELS